MKGRPCFAVLLAAGWVYVLSEDPPNQFGFSLFLSQMLLPPNLLYSLLSLSNYFPVDPTDSRVNQICSFQTSSSTFSPCCFYNSSRKIKILFQLESVLFQPLRYLRDSSVGSGLFHHTPTTLDLFKVFCLSKLSATEAQMVCYRHH